jgi:import inner membrane translocase subunit TIM22
MGDLDARPDGCVFKTSAAGLSGLFLGGILGAVQATWGDVPKVMKGKAVPALMKTGKVMGATGVTFAAIGASYAAAECLAAELRMTNDYANSFYGGAAAGLVLGARTGSMSVGIGSAAAIGAVTALVDATPSLRGSGLFNDNQTPARDYFPYASKA